ncbi:MAG TPA: UDP-N-acetylglucosamine 2-epimerase (non-hydrolyzing) [Rhizomicrobium sp.]|nr:UDP-N-acetylglucosamine 2-epimerase (non-hydrolyzing) [Rhizomicrobium sp.]
MKQRIAIIVGTRPEAIKMAPVVLALREEPALETILVATGQHRQMLQQAFDIFGIVPDHDLSVMRAGQTLSGLTNSVIAGVDAFLEAANVSRIIVHGDTTTAMAASIAAFHRGIAIGHVEAGLRTGNLAKPFPEEFNRRCVDLVADLLWAPTQSAHDNLMAENLPEGRRILVTGNTVVDALLWASARLDAEPELRAAVARALPAPGRERRRILVTGHRRESFGRGFENICQALRRLASRSDVEIVYPVHLNPNVVGPVQAILSGIPNVHLIEPLDYLAFVYLMKSCDVILTDSGGVQEEAPSLGKPVLVMRDVTERPEAVAAGTAQLVGTDPERIVISVLRLLDAPGSWQFSAANPYGDGKASERIAKSLLSQ